MENFTKNEILAFCANGTKKVRGITGERKACVTETKEGLGYTTQAFAIYLSFVDKIMEELTKSQKRIFVTGVMTHELLHIMLSSFPLLIKTLDKLPKLEQKIFASINNIFEDTFIENASTQFIEGDLLDSLYYTKQYIYKKSPKINEGRDAFEQFTIAHIQFGDVGVLKGEFTFPEAEEMFIKTLPLHIQYAQTISPEKRIKISLEAFEMTRPLWEKDLEELQEFLEELAKIFSQNEGAMEEADGEELESSSGMKSKAKAMKKMSKSSKSDEKSEEKGEVGKGAGEEMSEDSSDEKSEGESGKDSSGEKSEDGCETDEAGETGEAGEQPQKSEEELSETLEKELASMIKAINSQNEIKGEIKEIPLLHDGIKNICKKSTVSNEIEEPRDDEYSKNAYKKIVGEMKQDITKLARSLSLIFEAEKEEKAYRCEGKTSIKRLTSGTVTTRVFERTILPEQKSDLAVMLLIDESGSMSSNDKSIIARMSAIALAEVFAKIEGVQLYVMGFTADEGAKVNHHHYINWKNTPENRRKLLSITDRSNNFDSFSIRTGTALLNKVDSEHKLMIVVSDGYPACSAYSYEEGIQDTKLSIQEAKRIAPIVGVLLGGENSTAHKQMYGEDLIHIKNVSELFSGIMKIIKRQLKY